MRATSTYVFRLLLHIKSSVCVSLTTSAYRNKKGKVKRKLVFGRRTSPEGGHEFFPGFGARPHDLVHWRGFWLVLDSPESRILLLRAGDELEEDGRGAAPLEVYGLVVEGGGRK